MKKFLALFICMVLAIPCVAFSDPKIVPITWQEFWEKYNLCRTQLLQEDTADAPVVEMMVATDDDSYVCFRIADLYNDISGLIIRKTSVVAMAKILVPNKGTLSETLVPWCSLSYAMGFSDSPSFMSFMGINNTLASKQNGYSAYYLSLDQDTFINYKNNSCIFLDGFNAENKTITSEKTREFSIPAEYLVAQFDKTMPGNGLLRERTRGKTDAVALSPGEYVAGDHIALGEYKVAPVNKPALLTVYRNGSLRMSEVLNPDDEDEIGRLVLESGDTISISNGKLTFTPIQ